MINNKLNRVCDAFNATKYSVPKTRKKYEEKIARVS